jgi:O-antigen ligase
MAVTTALYCVAKRYWLFLLVLAAAALVLVVAAPSVEGESVFERLRLLSLPTDETVVQRLGLGELAWQEFVQHPMFGSGFSLPVTGQYPHNIVLDTGMAMGIFGVALFLSLSAAGLWRAFLAMTGSGDEFMASMFIYDLVASQFSGALWSQTVLFVAMGRLLSHPAAHLATNYHVGERRRTFVPLGNSYTVD